MFKKILTWFPSVLLLIFLLVTIADIGGGAEPVVFVVLGVIQAVIIGVPIAANWAGRKIGELRSS